MKKNNLLVAIEMPTRAATHVQKIPKVRLISVALWMTRLSHACLSSSLYKMSIDIERFKILKFQLQILKYVFGSADDIHCIPGVEGQYRTQLCNGIRLLNGCV